MCATLQEDYPGAAVNSGVIASKPNHPVWDKAFEIMFEREGECLPGKDQLSCSSPAQQRGGSLHQLSAKLVRLCVVCGAWKSNKLLC